MDTTKEAIRLLDEVIRHILPPEDLLSDDGNMPSNVESLFLTVKNSPHTREQAKRILLYQLDEQIKMVEEYDGILEQVPTEAIAEDKFETWYESWSNKINHLMLLRLKVQNLEF